MLIQIAVLLVVASGAGSAAAQAQPSESTGAETAPRFGVEASLGARFTSNLFHVQNRHLSLFETETGPGQRFFDMVGPADLLLEGEALGSVRFPFGERRHLRLELGAGFELPLFSTIAHRLELLFGAAFRIARRDRLELDVSIVPHAFRKNYEAVVGGASLYRPGYYFEAAPALGYTHGFGRRFRLGLEYELTLRRFESPFDARDYDAHLVTLSGEVEPSKRITLGLDLGGEVRLGGPVLEFGETVDRSSLALLGAVRFEWHPGKRFSLELGFDLRVREFTTDQATDATYFDRTDVRLRAQAAMEIRLGEGFGLAAAFEWEQNLVNRIDFSSDEADYLELEGSLSLSYEFEQS